MQKPIPSPQYWTGESAQWAARQLGLPCHSIDQDWPWIVAVSEDLERYFHLYSQIEPCAVAAVRIVVMEMILASASNGRLSIDELQEAWPRIKALLDQDADMLATTAQYWCCWDAEEQNLDEEGFRVSPYMREWWRANYPLPTNTIE